MKIQFNSIQLNSISEGIQLLRQATLAAALFVPVALLSACEEDNTNQTENPSHWGTTGEIKITTPEEVKNRSENLQVASQQRRILRREFLQHVAETFEPDPGRYDFLGLVKADTQTEDDVWVHGDASFAKSIDELYPRNHKRRNPFRSLDKITPKKEPQDDGEREEMDDVGRGILTTADGRVYLEKQSVVDSRRNQAKKFMYKHRKSEGGDLQGRGRSESIDLRFRDKFHGSDSRTAVVSGAAGYPNRVFSALLDRRNESDNFHDETNYFCSATMISPRVALTAAHCLDNNGNGILDKSSIVVVPGARGPTYHGYPDIMDEQDAPFGIRPVVGYEWPGQWDGWDPGSTNTKYDYAVVILDDISWSPGYISFGHASKRWLDYKYFSSQAYPGPGKACADSYTGDGKCSGYQYYIYDRVNAVFTNTMYHWLDMQGGESGSPIVDNNSGTLTIYGIRTGDSPTTIFGKRLRSGSYGGICDWVMENPSSYFSYNGC